MARKRVVTGEVVSKLDDLRERLAMAGATSEEVDSFVDAWNLPAPPEGEVIEDDAEYGYTAAERERFWGMSDAQLAAEVLASRNEYDFQTLTPAEELERDANAVRARIEAEAHAALVEEALAESAGNVKEFLAWVGDDLDRVEAALEVELASARPRHGVVEPLQDALTVAAGPDSPDAPDAGGSAAAGD